MLSTGEFAKLCKTTKETLFHYDRIGLFKPRSIDRNGFRLYGIDQFFEFNVVTLLKETGSSLSTIKNQLQQFDSEQMIDILKTKRQCILEERRKLLSKQHVVEDLIECLDHAQTLPKNRFDLVDEPERAIDIYTFKRNFELSDTSIERNIQQFLEYFDFFAQQRNQPRAPYGVTIALADLLHGRIIENAAFSMATSTTPKSRRVVIPAGLYARSVLRCSLESQIEQVGVFLQHVKDHQLKPVSDLYIYDLMSYSREGYLSEFLIRVEQTR